MTEQLHSPDRTNRELIPYCFKVFKFHNYLVANAILFTMEEGEGLKVAQISERIEASLGESVPTSTIAHTLPDLAWLDLIRRTGSKRSSAHSLSPLAIASKEAFLSMINHLADPIKSETLERARVDYDSQVPEELEQAIEQFEPSATKQVPALRRVLTALSNETRLRILITLGEKVGEPTSYRGIFSALDEQGKKVPASTLSNQLTRLEQANLITRGSDNFSLSELGLEAINAYLIYQEQTRKPALTSHAGILERDLGLDQGSLRIPSLT